MIGLLLRTSKSPGWGKVKPRQWGPLSAVYSSLLRQAEHIGIDPSAVTLFMPFWSVAGQPVDIVSGDDFALTGEWTPYGVNFRNNGSDVVEIPHRPSLNVGSSDFTYLVKTRDLVAATSPGQGIFCKYALGDVSTPSVTLSTYNGKYYWRVRDDSNQQIVIYNGGPDPDSDVVVGVRSGESASLYVGGDLVGEGSNSSLGSPDNANSVSIGRYWTTPAMRGGVDFAAIIKQALTADQIALITDAPYTFLSRSAPVVIFDLGSANSRVTMETAWTIRTAEEKPISWRVATAAIKSTAWRIHNSTAPLETAWRIFAESVQASAWTIRAAAAADTAWRILTVADKETGWRVLGGIDRATAWRILNATTVETAWQIITGGLLTLNTAWRIEGTATKETAYRIQAGVENDLVWRIAEAASKETAWRIQHTITKETAWRVQSSVEQDTAWRVLTVTDQDVAWRISAELEKDTAWRILTAEELATAWDIDSEDIPAPIKTFLATNRTTLFTANNRRLAFNATNRTLIFLAD